MKKSCLVAFIALICSPFAYAVNVGDYVHMSYKQTGNYGTFSGAFEKEVLSYDKSTDTYAVKLTMTRVGQAPSIEIDNIKSKEIFIQAQAQYALKMCGSTADTALETLSTPLGALSTCVVKNEGEDHTLTEWVADIPFGDAKLVLTEKNFQTTLIVQSYRFGK